MHPQNILAHDGIVEYYGTVMPAEEADHYLHVLLTTIAWQHDEARIFGRHYITKRKVAWYGDKDYEYAYSGANRVALPWTPELLQLKQLTESLSGYTYNSCLLNLYHSGDEGMAWHSDDEKALMKDGAIASLSFGAERKFSLKHRKDQHLTRSLMLAHGSLLVMRGATQTHWLHALPKQLRVKSARVNLTFRTMVG